MRKLLRLALTLGLPCAAVVLGVVETAHASTKPASHHHRKIVRASYPGPTTSTTTGGAPVNTAVPTISGQVGQGQALTETHGTWTDSPTSYAYQWGDCAASGGGCVDIPGATSQTYTLAASDIGDAIQVAETASNAAGTGTAAVSPTALADPPCSLYASLTGSDSTGDGTKGNPWATPGKLVAALSAGSPVGCLEGGVYNLAGLLDITAAGGTAGAPLTLMADPGQAVTLKWASICNCVGVHMEGSAPFFTLANMTLDNTGVAQVTTWISGQGDALEHDVVNNGSTGSGTGMGVDCVFIDGSVAATINENQLENCGNTSDGQNDQGIYSANTNGTLITNNVIWNAAGFGIQLWPKALNNIVSHNVVDDSGNGGVIYAGSVSTPSAGNLVTQNIVSNALGQYLVQSYWGATPGVGNTFNNNCVFNGHLGDIQSPQVGFTATGNLDGQDPLYTNAGAHTYTLQAGSPCLPVVGYDTAALIGGSSPPIPVDSTLPTIVGTAQQGQTLNESNGTLTNSPTSFNHQWERCDSSGANCAPVAGSTGSSYVLGAGDVGSTIRVQEVAGNASGSGPAVVSNATGVVSAGGNLGPLCTTNGLAGGTPTACANGTSTHYCPGCEALVADDKKLCAPVQRYRSSCSARAPRAPHRRDRARQGRQTRAHRHATVRPTRAASGSQKTGLRSERSRGSDRDQHAGSDAGADRRRRDEPPGASLRRDGGDRSSEAYIPASSRHRSGQ